MEKDSILTPMVDLFDFSLIETLFITYCENNDCSDCGKYQELYKYGLKTCYELVQRHPHEFFYHIQPFLEDMANNCKYCGNIPAISIKISDMNDNPSATIGCPCREGLLYVNNFRNVSDLIDQWNIGQRTVG